MNAQENAVANGWIMTASGRKFYPLAPNCEQLALYDIAHALSMQCRWNGHTRVFYSVAQHCVLMSELCHAHPAEALMHDASEAYISDVPKPVKRQLPEFEAHEDRLLRRIFECWGLVYPLPKEVKLCDDILLRWEARDLFSDDRCVQIFGAGSRDSIRHLPPIEPLTPREAERLFIDRAISLGVTHFEKR